MLENNDSVQFKGKLMNQTQENDTKFILGMT